MDRVILRQARKSNIQHNKFMVLLKRTKKTPDEVWTGSTNISDGGIHGQTNVGHWVRNSEVADRFRAYWDILSKDPGGQTGDDRAAVQKKNKAFAADVEKIQDVPPLTKNLPAGVTTVFSPRTALKVLEMYFDMIDEAASVACIALVVGDDLDRGAAVVVGGRGLDAGVGLHRRKTGGQSLSLVWLSDPSLP